MALKEAVKAVDENKLQDLQVIHSGAQVERKIEAKAKGGTRWSPKGSHMVSRVPKC